MKPEGVPGSSVTAIGVGLFVAFGGILFGLVSTHWQLSAPANEDADTIREPLGVSLQCRSG